MTFVVIRMFLRPTNANAALARSARSLIIQEKPIIEPSTWLVIKVSIE